MSKCLPKKYGFYNHPQSAKLISNFVRQTTAFLMGFPKRYHKVQVAIGGYLFCLGEMRVPPISSLHSGLQNFNK